MSGPQENQPGPPSLLEFARLLVGIPRTQAEAVLKAALLLVVLAVIAIIRLRGIDAEAVLTNGILWSLIGK